ncbi:glutamate 5-kinase [Candidatus Woesearchaeota archaeon]|nr:glutamate 5-kinase [Candidatus Woesearchaeota archaeon]
MRQFKASRIVVKIGTKVITNANGTLNLKIMNRLVGQIVEMQSAGKEVLIITSGAIGAGMMELRLKERPRNVVMQQVCASIGQHLLISSYHSLFKRHGVKVAQILLTYSDFSNKKISSYLCRSLNKILEMRAIPIINENDPISIDEIGPSFGDNDILSALIASKMHADLLIILTDVGGLLNKMQRDRPAALIKEVKIIDKSIESLGGNSNGIGLGGMKTKIKAAKIATKAGSNVIIANGKSNNVLFNIVNKKEIGTFFLANSKSL